MRRTRAASRRTFVDRNARPVKIRVEGVGNRQVAGAGIDRTGDRILPGIRKDRDWLRSAAGKLEHVRGLRVGYKDVAVFVGALALRLWKPVSVPTGAPEGKAKICTRRSRVGAYSSFSLATARRRREGSRSWRTGPSRARDHQRSTRYSVRAASRRARAAGALLQVASRPSASPRWAEGKSAFSSDRVWLGASYAARRRPPPRPTSRLPRNAAARDIR